MFLLIVLYGTTCSSAMACGIDWVVPANHFENVNESGDLSYWRDIGTINLGEGLKIPLIIGFKPNRGSISRLGRGWIMPLIEANVIQVDEKKFLLTQPDGISRQFWRRKLEDTILEGQGNWMGEIRGNTITLWADCGWKLLFTNGKITSITTPQNRVLNVVYGSYGPEKIIENGQEVFQIESTAAGTVIGLRFSSTQIGIEIDKRPRVEEVTGRKMVGGYEQSLWRIRFPDNKEAIYDFAVDEQLQPTLKISGDSEHAFTWDAQTGKILKDGEWAYNIKPGKEWWHHAEQERINTKGEKEFWFKDVVNGKEIVITADGSKTMETQFVSGGFSGKIREKIKQTNDKFEKNKFFYNGNGGLLYHDYLLKDQNQSGTIINTRRFFINDGFIEYKK